MSAKKSEPIEGEIVETPPIEQDDPIAILIVRKAGKGRPSKMTLDVLGKLIAAFNNDYTIEQASDYADINPDTYYEWAKKFPYFSEKMRQAKQAPLRRSREIVVGAINAGDSNLAFRYLERRDPEFKPKAEVDNNQAYSETRKKLKDFLDDNDIPDDEREQPSTADSETARGEVAEAPTDIS